YAMPLSRARRRAVEQVPVVLRLVTVVASRLHASIAPHTSPPLIESVRAVDRKDHAHPLAAGEHSPSFADVQLLGVRRAVDVDERPVVQADSIDDEGVAFVMADRLAVP